MKSLLVNILVFLILLAVAMAMVFLNGDSESGADRLRAAARLREQLRRQCPAHSLPPRRRYRKGDRRQGAFYRQLRRTMGLGEAAAGGVRFPHESPKGKKAERLLNTKE